MTYRTQDNGDFRSLDARSNDPGSYAREMEAARAARTMREAHNNAALRRADLGFAVVVGLCLGCVAFAALAIWGPL